MDFQGFPVDVPWLYFFPCQKPWVSCHVSSRRPSSSGATASNRFQRRSETIRIGLGKLSRVMVPCGILPLNKNTSSTIWGCFLPFEDALDPTWCQASKWYYWLIIGDDLWMAFLANLSGINIFFEGTTLDWNHGWKPICGSLFLIT